MDKGYEIRHTGDLKGIGLFATKSFKENEVILEETPLVAAQFAWNEAYNYLACHHCLRPLEGTEENVQRLTGNKGSILPYPELCPTDKTKHTTCEDCGVTFCCKNCKQLAAHQYHEKLCLKKRPDLSLLIDTWKTIHYPPETTTIMLMARIIATIEQSQDKNQALSTFLQFSHEVSDHDETMMMKILGTEGAEKLSILAQIMPQTISTSSASRALVTEDGLRTLFALVGRNGQGIGTSVFSQWVGKAQALDLPLHEKAKIDQFIESAYDGMDKHVGSFLNCEGSGLYAIQRCVNHSCRPNAEVTFPRGDYTLVLAAQKEILPGDEITTSYLEECALSRSRHSRNVILREYYLFECSCEKCIEQADDVDETSEDEDDSDDEMI